MNNSKKIVWLASYPKSGNTWLRAFITALLNDGDVDLNNMVSDQIFSSRTVLTESTDLDSTYLSNEEAKILQPQVFDHIANITEKERLFIKVHDAYTFNLNNLPLIPAGGTQCAIYIVRNPLDIAASLANHKDVNIDEAIGMLNDDNAKFSEQDNNLNIKVQFEQLLLTWSGHVESWTSGLPFPVLVMRYEDMLADTFNTFAAAVNFLGITVSNAQLEKAIAASDFKQLQQKEQENGFVERTHAESFFRKGKAGSWRDELTENQIGTILSHHRAVMDTYGYTAL
jgi:hypothetical protein